MNRRMGAESGGLGAGMISPESQRNLDIAENLCRTRRPNEALPYLEKAMNDPRNLDAWVQLAFLAPTLKESTEILLAAEKQGKALLKQDLGPKCFDDDGDRVGHFWGLLETRPYMRTLQALVRIHQENKRPDLAADTGIEMLRLCPGDNPGQRQVLGSNLLKANRAADALSFAQAWMFYDERAEIHPPRGGCAFATNPPSSAPLTPAQKRRLHRYTPHALVHTAALAAFKLFGDCELARQYLVFATGLNPHVMLKVLARVDQPKSLVSTPRQSNSTEDAHDYLWATQDLWMQDDVWNWADGNPDVKALVLKKCSRGECEVRETKVAQFKRCAACHNAWYCGTACQKGDWEQHKPDCRRHTDSKKMYQRLMQGR